MEKKPPISEDFFVKTFKTKEEWVEHVDQINDMETKEHNKRMVKIDRKYRILSTIPFIILLIILIVEFLLT
jgi:hypothetical protein